MIKKHLGIDIDLSRNEGFSEQALTLLKEYYCLPNEDPQEALARASVAYSEGDLEFAQRIYDYASKRWFMFASPVLSNAPLPDQKPTGLPISCFLTFVDDTLESLIHHNSEVAWLSVMGGGVGGHWGAVRPVTDKAPGVIPFMKVVDSQMTAYKQGKTRKGSYAAYLDVSHPDIVAFAKFRVPTGDIDRKCRNLFNAVNITDDFMDAVEKGNEWRLIDPSTGDVRATVPARDLWQTLLEARFRTGAPYLNFIDTARRAMPVAQKALGLDIHGSNLCNEIHLATDNDRTAVCCLSSVNLEKFDDWADTDMVADLTRLLDNVLSVFIRHAPDAISKARYSAQQERAIGLGAMGFHGYLQKNGIAWDGMYASSANYRMFKRIKEQAEKESERLGKLLGEAPDMVGTGRRNSHLLAIAPNANSSIICGCTPSIEPLKANAFTHRTRAGASLVKNPYLEKELEKLDMNTPDVWKSIISNEGSVQHLDISDELKAIYRTAFEIDQTWVVEHASKRQHFICQGQSVNLFFAAGSPKPYVNKVHFDAWKKGLKGLYYLRTSAGVTADKVGLTVDRVALKDGGEDECLSCHG